MQERLRRRARFVSRHENRPHRASAGTLMPCRGPSATLADEGVWLLRGPEIEREHKASRAVRTDNGTCAEISVTWRLRHGLGCRQDAAQRRGRVLDLIGLAMEGVGFEPT